VWTSENVKWVEFSGLKVQRIWGDTPARDRTLTSLGTPQQADIYVINYELVPWLTSRLRGRWPFKTVIADESSKLKSFRLNKGGVRAQCLSTIAKFTGRWINLTGTPCPNGLQDLWGQMWFVDFGQSLGRTYSDYMARYFIEDPYTKKRGMQHNAEAEIHAAVAGKMLALRAEDWLDVKEPLVIPVEFEMPADAQAHYDRMERSFFIELGELGIEALTAAAKSGKLLQMSAGSIYDEFGTAHHVHAGRIDALQDVVEQAGENLLVSYWWRFDVTRIQKAFPEAVLYQGEREQDRWNEGKIKMLLIHQQASYGVSLHHGGRDMVFYSYVWNAEHRQQMIERVGPARQAQAGYNRVVRIWDICAHGTMDQDVLDSNAGKISIEQGLKRARARQA
jgi:hypothetical protein